MSFNVDINMLDIFVMYTDNTIMSYDDQYIKQVAAPSNIYLNEQQAITIIRDYFNYTNVIYTYDHDSQIDGEVFYLIHVYEDHPTHTATVGWYGHRNLLVEHMMKFYVNTLIKEQPRWDQVVTLACAQNN